MKTWHTQKRGVGDFPGPLCIKVGILGTHRDRIVPAGGGYRRRGRKDHQTTRSTGQCKVHQPPKKHRILLHPEDSFSIIGKMGEETREGQCRVKNKAFYELSADPRTPTVVNPFTFEMTSALSS